MYLRFVIPTPCLSSPSSLPFLKLVFFMQFWMSLSTSVPPTLALLSLPSATSAPLQLFQPLWFHQPSRHALACWCDPAPVAPQPHLLYSASLLLLIQPHQPPFYNSTCTNPCPFPGLGTCSFHSPRFSPPCSHTADSSSSLGSWLRYSLSERPFLNHTWCVTLVSSLSELCSKELC